MALGPQTAIIGLGSMGWGAAVSLLRAGIATIGVDINQEVLVRFEGEGGQTADSPAAAAENADIVFVFVVNEKQTREVLFGVGGAAAAAKPGTVFALCVTMPPSSSIQIAQELEAKGMLVIDAPVSGGSLKASNGEMTIMASGPQEAFAIAEPALGAISAKVFRLSDQPGMGSQVKMINQLLAGVHIAATAEAMALGAGIGVDLETLYDVIRECAGNSWMFENRGAHIVKGDYTPHSAVDIFVKDLGIVASESAANNFSTPMTATALDLFQEASAAGMGREDDAALAKLLARRGRVKLPGMTQ
ncbi:MAG: NAD(P)-dependent oxidoreductase [Hyphomicrobiales bacterium]